MMNWETAKRRLEDYWRSRGLTPQTIRVRLRLLDDFLAHTGDQAPENIPTARVYTWASPERYASNTVALYLKTLKGIMRDLWQLNLCAWTPLCTLKTQPARRRKRAPLDIEELGKISDLLYSLGNDRRAVYERLLFTLLVTWAPRASEICGLRWTNVRWQQRCVSFHQAKSGAPRELALTPDLENSLLAWYRVSGCPTWIFRFAPHPSTGYEKAPHRETLYRLIRRWFADAGLDRREAGTHLFRHTLATRCYEATKDMAQVRDVLGHSRTATTERYVHTPGPRADVAARMTEALVRRPENVITLAGRRAAGRPDAAGKDGKSGDEHE